MSGEVVEDEVVRRWWSLSVGCILPLTNGQRYQLLFAGRSGGPAGPDVRDAVLLRLASDGDGERLVGDVEFHTRAGGWHAHRHHSDPRYNHVILHVVLRCDGLQPTRCQDGRLVPVCSLYDLPLSAFANPPENARASWPCHSVLASHDEAGRQLLLNRAGLARLELKAQAFITQLHGLGEQFPGLGASTCKDVHDIVLIPALAEGLGYGRDRDFFRAAGLYLLGLTASLPEPLGHTSQPAPLDARRLRVLRTFMQRWHQGVWRTLRGPLLEENAPGLRKLRHLFTSSGLSLARADIIIINVVLPFAMAMATLEQNAELLSHSYSLYTYHPGLTSNQITRMMSRQLYLEEQPRGACQQQGLHHIYQQSCREKRCDLCIVSKRSI